MLHFLLFFYQVFLTSPLLQWGILTSPFFCSPAIRQLCTLYFLQCCSFHSLATLFPIVSLKQKKPREKKEVLFWQFLLVATSWFLIIEALIVATDSPLLLFAHFFTWWLIKNLKGITMGESPSQEKYSLCVACIGTTGYDVLLLSNFPLETRRIG